MLSKSQVSLLTALHHKKFRQNYRKFTVEGEKIVSETLRQKQFEVEAIFGLPEWAAHLEGDLNFLKDKFVSINEAELKKVSSLNTPNKVLALLKIPEPIPIQPVPSEKLAIYLDGLQDPSNLGAILRVADWFGVQAVFCSPDAVDVFNQKSIQASMGAFLRVHVQVVELRELTKQQPNLSVFGAVLDGENIFEIATPAGGLLVIGNEGRGIRPENIPYLSRRVSIPRAAGGGAESLNAAVATGILTAFLCRK